MPRSDNAQLNIRSAYARSRVHEIAAVTGMTATEIVEDAPQPVESLVRRGPVLVKPAAGRRVTRQEADEALEAVRGRDL